MRVLLSLLIAFPKQQNKIKALKHSVRALLILLIILLSSTKNTSHGSALKKQLLGQNIVLSVGEKQSIQVASHTVFHVGNKKIASLSLKDKVLNILGKTEGQTYIRFGSQRYQLIVTQTDIQQHIFLIDKIVRDCWGLNWVFSPQKKLQIVGVLNRMYDWVQIAKIAKAHNIDYEFKAQLGENLEPSVLSFFKKIIKSQTLPEIQWDMLPLALIPQEENLNLYKKFKYFGLKIQKDKTWFHPSQFIEIRIALIEISSSSGLFFGKNKSNKILPLQSILKLLNLLKAKGHGKTIYHTSVMAQHGKSLRIHNGGEIPFSQYNPETNHYTTQWKSYGLDLKLLALVGKKGNIQIDVKGVISEPAAAIGDSPPPIKSQSIQNSFQVKNKSVLKLFSQEKENDSIFSKGSLGLSLPLLDSFARKSEKNKTFQMILMEVNLSNSFETKSKTNLSNRNKIKERINLLKSLKE